VDIKYERIIIVLTEFFPSSWENELPHMNQPYETRGWFGILWINCKRKFKYTHEYETKGMRTVL
jgi:hypothetical protein